MKIFLSNNFHDTETYIRPRPLGNGYYGSCKACAIGIVRYRGVRMW